MKDINSLLERIASSAVILAALTLVFVLVRSELLPSTPGLGTPDAAPVQLDDWRSILLSSGIWVGDSNAAYIVVEFADFECPFCRRFHEAYLDAKGELGDSLALYFIHFPIPGHRLARPAAQAAMCADEQGRFGEYHDALFRKQDSLGLKSWWEFASEAGVPDEKRFESCLHSGDEHPLIARGIELGVEIGVRGTPWVITNGLQHRSVPPFENLAEVLRTNLGP